MGIYLLVDSNMIFLSEYGNRCKGEGKREGRNGKRKQAILRGKIICVHCSVDVRMNVPSYRFES